MDNMKNKLNFLMILLMVVLGTNHVSAQCSPERILHQEGDTKLTIEDGRYYLAFQNKDQTVIDIAIISFSSKENVVAFFEAVDTLFENGYKTGDQITFDFAPPVSKTYKIFGVKIIGSNANKYTYMTRPQCRRFLESLLVYKR